MRRTLRLLIPENRIMRAILWDWLVMLLISALIVVMMLALMFGCAPKPAVNGIGFTPRPVRSQQVEVVFPDAPPPSNPR